MTDAALPETYCATVWIRHGRAVYVGPSLKLGEHSGAVHCFALGIDAPFTVHCGTTVGYDVRSALIPARTPHRLVAGTGRVLFAYVDPGSPWAARMSSRMTGSAIHYGHPDELALAARLLTAGASDPLSLLGLDDDPADPRDERIRTALALLRQDPGGRLGAADVARAVNLSPSRFQHLFTSHTGTSFRRYRSWARMLHVADAVAGGTNLTTAATDAGFASSAHFSDSFRTMFGLSASRLLAPGTRILTRDRRGSR